MKLRSLKNCDIYRDGGSLEGIWLDEKNEEWAVTLLINDDIEVAHNDFNKRWFHLYNCKRNEVDSNIKIDKGTDFHRNIISKIDNWVEELNPIIEPQSRIEELIKALHYGNY